MDANTSFSNHAARTTIVRPVDARARHAKASTAVDEAVAAVVGIEGADGSGDVQHWLALAGAARRLLSIAGAELRGRRSQAR